MTPFVHRLSLTFYFTVVLIAIGTLSYYGRTYYNLPVENRYYTASGEVNTMNDLLKPNGIIGHSLGIIGTGILVIGVFGYIARKRLKVFSRVGVLKYWLEFHIFLCTLGPVFILFHTAFKFGGLVALSFWSMAIVWASGIIGRYIYLQIPQSIEGRALSLQEVKEQKENLDAEFSLKYNLSYSEVSSSRFSKIKSKLISQNTSRSEIKQIKALIKTEKQLTRRMKRLDQMQNLFRYWHVIHLPFALIMLIIMVIHVGVAIFFGYSGMSSLRSFWELSSNGLLFK